MDIDDLARRVQALEDEREIVRTLHRYGHCIDYGLDAEWVDCFTPDGVFDLRLRVLGTTRRIEGAANLTAFIATHTNAPAAYHKHLVSDTVVSLDGDTAYAESLFHRIDADDSGAPFLYSFGRYLDTLRRCPDGRWRIAERVAESEGRAPGR
jgi:ketosteroid isomerase-like protein